MDITIQIPNAHELYHIANDAATGKLPPETSGLKRCCDRIVLACRDAAEHGGFHTSIRVPVNYANEVARKLDAAQYGVQIIPDTDEYPDEPDECIFEIDWKQASSGYPNGSRNSTVKLGTKLWQLWDRDDFVPSIEGIAGWSIPEYYTHDAIIELKNLGYLPKGFRIPTVDDWNDLYTYLGASTRKILNFQYPGTMRTPLSSQGKVGEKGERAYYWTEQEYDIPGRYLMACISPTGYGIGHLPEDIGLCLRLVKDSDDAVKTYDDVQREG